MNELYSQATDVMKELGDKAKLKAGDVVVVGCCSISVGKQQNRRCYSSCCSNKAKIYLWQ